MKKMLTALALAVFLTGCASDNTSARSKRAARQKRVPVKVTPAPAPAQDYTQYTKNTYSWDSAPKQGNETQALTAPENSSLAVIKEVRGDLGLISLLRSEKPAVGEQFILNKDDKVMFIRIVEIDGENIIASIPAGQDNLPTVAVGAQVSLTTAAAPEAK